MTSPIPRFDLLGPDDYDRAKKVLNAAKHPGFVGRELFYRCATTGRACIAVVEEADLGVALIAKDKLQALSVSLKAQGRGVGSALMAHLKPRWVSAIEEKVGWFERLGYRRVGASKVGANGKHATQLMERSDLENSRAPTIKPKVQPKSSSKPKTAVLTAPISALEGCRASVARAQAQIDALPEDADIGDRKRAEEMYLRAVQTLARVSGEAEITAPMILRSKHWGRLMRALGDALEGFPGALDAAAQALEQAATLN